MAMALQTNPKWDEPKPSWSGGETPAPLEAMLSEADVSRYHNREELSPEAMAEAIADLKASVGSLGGRVAAVEEGAAGAVHAAKDLGVGMVKMGDALTKRVHELEDEARRAGMEAASAKASADLANQAAATAREALAAERRTREKLVRTAIAAGVTLAVAAAGVSFLGSQFVASHAKPAEVLYAPSTASGK